MLAVDLPSLESIILEAPFHSWAWADTLSLGDMVVWGGREVGKYGTGLQSSRSLSPSQAPASTGHQAILPQAAGWEPPSLCLPVCPRVRSPDSPVAVAGGGVGLQG